MAYALVQGDINTFKNVATKNRARNGTRFTRKTSRERHGLSRKATATVALRANRASCPQAVFKQPGSQHKKTTAFLSRFEKETK